MRELKQLALILKESYVFENESACLEKTCRTQWTDHKMRAMKKLSNKFVSFLLRRKCDCATLQGKYNNLTQASVLLRSTFLSDILQPA